MKSRQLALALSALALSVCIADAGEIRAVGKSFPEKTPEAKVALTGTDLALVETRQGVWRFSLSSQSGVFSSLLVTSQADGYDGYSMEFSIPYYWDGPLPRTITAPVVKDALNDSGVVDFYGSTRSQLSSEQAISLIHQRSKRLWKWRSSQLRGGGVFAPSKDDVVIAYWLVVTMMQLIQRQSAVVDEETADASSWLRDMIADTSERARLFRSDTVPADTVKTLIDFVGARDAYVYNRAVQALESDLNAGKPSTCERLKSLNDVLFSIPFDDRKNYDGQFGNSIKVKDSILVCLRREIAPRGPIRSDITPEELDRARNEVKVAEAALAEAEGAGLYEAPRRLLKARIDDMQILFNNR